MQIYTDPNGIQRLLLSGKVAMDSETGETAHPVVWDTDTDGGEIAPAKIGGYSRDGDTLVYSQQDFDANEAAKATLAEAQAASAFAQTKQQATLALIGSAAGQPINMLQKAFAGAVVHYLDGIAKGNIVGVTIEEFTASIALQINAFGSIQQGGK